MPGIPPLEPPVEAPPLPTGSAQKVTLSDEQASSAGPAQRLMHTAREKVASDGSVLSGERDGAFVRSSGVKSRDFRSGASVEALSSSTEMARVAAVGTSFESRGRKVRQGLTWRAISDYT